MNPASTTWRETRVAPDGTHHLLGTEPFYAARFLEVLKFHDPGLAPVRDVTGSYHIDARGLEAYTRRFTRTFGFYEGLAAAAAEDGWRHIRVDGEPAYSGRWAWCGNFQGGRCPARDADGLYFHIKPDGEPVCTERFRYVGDYKDGFAVAQGDDGLSTHVDLQGDEVHGVWFVDLDVFHKGYARARDDKGWMHVDDRGHPVYTRRFTSVEPFYNGQARVERDDGGVEVIDERGECLVELRPARRSAFSVASAELASFWRCDAVFAAVDAGLFERLPLADARVRQAEQRLLGALAELGLVQRVHATWTATTAGAHFRADHPRSLAAASRYWATEGRRAWAQLPAALVDPRWHPSDPFEAASSDAAQVAALQGALRPYAEEDYAGIANVVDPHGEVIDAGGGSGALAVALLRGWPDARGVVFDRPEVVATGVAPPDLARRMRFVGGDLFAPWGVSGSTVVLARVLHDWPDERAVDILARARAAVRPGGKLYVVEMVRTNDAPRGGLLSLHMFLATGGRERNLEDFRTLFWRAGWELREVRKLGPVSDVIVAVAS